MKRKMMKDSIAILVLISMALFSACSKNGHGGSALVKTFVLVHGVWQAPWAWDQVRERLEKAGQHVVIVQLPAHGSDLTPPGKTTISLYREVVINAINAINTSHDKIAKGQKVILVGHSMAGMVISAVADSIPDQIEKMVYIGAYLPANGQSLLDLANTDAQSFLGTELILSADSTLLNILPENLVKTFCQDCSVSLQQQLIANFRPEPAIPFGNPVKLSTGFTRTSKYYIHTLHDHVVGPDLQDRMIAKTNIIKVYPISSSHCPFLSKPDDVTAILLDIIYH